MKFSDRLKEFRKQNNLTQQELADKLFVSRSAIAKWEQDRGLPSEELLQQISMLMDVPLDQLIDNQQLRNTVIKNQRNLSKQKRIILLLLCMGLVCLSLAVGLIIYNVKNAPQPTPEPKTQEDLFYAIANVEDNILYFEYDDESFVDTSNELFNKFSVQSIDLENSSVLCRDKHFNKCPLTEIKTPNHLEVVYKYKPVERWFETIELVEIRIIDDYYEGETSSFKGLFLSSFPYDKNYAPVPYGKYPDEVQNEVLSKNMWLYEKYPYIYTSDHEPRPCPRIDLGDHPYSSIVESEHRWHKTTKLLIEKKMTYNLCVQNNIADTIYVYMLDDSEKGYYEYCRLTKDNSSLEVKTFGFDTDYPKSNNIYKMDWIVSLKIDFIEYSIETVII